MSKIVNVTAANGVNYNVRLVEEGDRHGLNMCLTHNKPSIVTGKVNPMVEFYDTKSQFHYDFVGEPEEAKAAGAQCLGQFVSGYYVETLLENIATTNGICLHGGVPRWQIDGDAVRKAFVELGLWSYPQAEAAEACDTPLKLVVVYDSQDPDTEPQVWLPASQAHRFQLVPLNKSQELGGRYPNTDPADIELLDAGVNAAFPNYVQVQ
jgi:hypothetical protein